MGKKGKGNSTIADNFLVNFAGRNDSDSDDDTGRDYPATRDGDQWVEYVDALGRTIVISLNGEGISELVQPGAGSHHHRVVRLLHHLVHGALELLGLPDPDHDPAVVAVAWTTKKSNLFLLREVLGVLGVKDGVVDTLSFHALCDLPWFSDVDVHDQVLLIAFLIRDLQADCLRCFLVA